jgi:D-alanine-D-alanine ligase
LFKREKADDTNSITKTQNPKPKTMKKIAIVCGGNSGEYDISIQSGKVAEKHLDKNKFKEYRIVINKLDWHFKDEKGKKHTVDKADFSLDIDGTKVKFDGVFNAIHGTPGEDGKLQAYFDLLNIPYTSGGVASSALSFNKFYCNHFVRSMGITVADSISLRKGESYQKETVIEALGLPVFVKPVGSGSSVGVSKVNKAEELDTAIQIAFKEDNRILIESFIDGREIACGLVEKGSELIVFPLTEIISKNDFFDYEAKYKEGLAHEITPAKIPEEVEVDIKTTSSFLYRQMDCKGFVRFDYILTNTGLYFLEVNSIPGMTEASIIPQQAEAYGMNIQELFTIAVEGMF